MHSSFIILTFYYFFSIICTFGYGLFVKRFFINKNIKINYGFIGLIGIFFLTIYSYISHFFLDHSLAHNTVLFFIGILFFIIYIRSNFNKSEIKLFCIIFCVLLIAFYNFKTHDDFPYYHFPYTYFLTKSELIVGIGNYDHGWRTPSSIFYFNSLFYLPFIKHYLFHIGAILIMGFSLLSLSIDAYNKFVSKKIDVIFYFKILAIVFILVFFYRIAEHGTDRSAQILSFLLISEILFFLKKQKKFIDFSTKFLILSSLIVSLKSYYFTYLILIIPIIYFMYKEKKIGKISNLLKNNFFYFSTSLVLLILCVNIFNTGCLIYPLKYSCFENFSWSIPHHEIDKMVLHYENWSKAGSGVGFVVDNPENYVSNFNWVSNWIEKYFFYKVSDFILSLILISIIFISLLGSLKKRIKTEFNLKILYLCLFILFFEWFYNHPSLRYGGYSLIGIIFFLFTCKFLPDCRVNKKFSFRISILIVFTILIFYYRNFDRLQNEHQKYNYFPFFNAYYFIDDHHFRVQKDFEAIINFYKNCTQKKIKCENDSRLIAYEYYGKFVFVRKK